MKIGILTFHRSINYGAVVQCYTLSNEIKKRFPNDVVEVIDYVPKFRLNYYKPSVLRYIFGSTSKKNKLIFNIKIIVSQIIRLLKNFKEFRLIRTRYYAFQKSMEYLPLSSESYIQNDVEQFRKSVYGKYDAIIVGSDCVWEWTTIPLPNAYYLCGDFGSKKLSYAASVGTDDISLLGNDKIDLLKKSVNDFKYIGVRDTSSEYVLKQLKIPNMFWHHNCDPTTFLDTSTLIEYKEKVQEKMKKLKIADKQIKIAVMGSEKYGKIARQIFGDKATYFALYIPNKYCDYQFLDLDVLEWAASFSLFDLTFTTFFHGTMLSLVNLTPVISFDYLPETEHQITKLRELYKRLDLDGFYYRINGELSSEDIENIRLAAKKFVKNPPKKEINEAIKKESATAESFFNYLSQLHVGVI